MVTESFPPGWRAGGEEVQRWLKIKPVNSEDLGVNRRDIDSGDRVWRNLMMKATNFKINVGKDAEKEKNQSFKGLKKNGKEIIVTAFYMRPDSCKTWTKTSYSTTLFVGIKYPQNLDS